MRPLHALGVVALAAVWGSSYLLIKIGLRGFSPAMLVFTRTGVASLVLLALIAARGPVLRAALRDALRRPWRLAGLAFLAITLPFLLIGAAETTVPSGLAAVLVAAVPLFIAGMAPFVDASERVTRGRLTGMLVGLVGVALVVGAESVGSVEQSLAALALLGASASYAGGSFAATRWFGDVTPLVRSLCAVGGGCLLTLPIAAATTPDTAPGWGPAAAVLALAVFGTALAFILLYWLMDAVGAGRTALNTYLVPVFALGYGSAFLDERIAAGAYAGFVLVLVGVALAGRRDRPAPSRA